MMNPDARIGVVGGARTPFAKAGTVFKHHRALDLAAHSVDGLIEKLDVDPAIVDEMVYGIVTLDPKVPQFAREVNFRSQLPVDVRSYTITDNCITGITAVSNISESIRAGRATVGIAGGVESMSNPAIQFSQNASRVLYDLSQARSIGDRLKLLTKLRPRDVKPDAPPEKRDNGC